MDQSRIKRILAYLEAEAADAMEACPPWEEDDTSTAIAAAIKAIEERLI